MLQLPFATAIVVVADTFWILIEICVAARVVIHQIAHRDCGFTFEYTNEYCSIEDFLFFFQDENLLLLTRKFLFLAQISLNFEYSRLTSPFS